MGKLLTVIVPVYKVEQYINKCLDSLVLEDESLMKQLEVVIVNDGTPDNSAEMSREYVRSFPDTFRQIDKENGGHGSAWNVGLKEASGKYLRFLDSDDWLTNLDKLMMDLQKCDADVVFNPFAVVSSPNDYLVVSNPVLCGKGSNSDVFMARPITRNIWMNKGDKQSNVNFWGVTYKAEILKPLWPLFAEKVMYDDYILTWAPLIYGRTCVAFDYVLYNYFVGRPGNSMSVSQMQNRASSYKVCFRQYETTREKIEERNIPIELLECIDELIADHALFVFWYEAFLPYSESRANLKHLYLNYLKGNRITPVIKRYAKLPFFFFYWIEHLRYIINKR